MSLKRVSLGLLGCGTVGGALVDLIAKNRSLIEQRTGLDLRVTRALVRDTRKERPAGPEYITDAAQIVQADDIDVVVELLGGLQPAWTLIKRALDGKKPVVTANKALLAEVGQDLFEQAAHVGSTIAFEASVCAGLPVIRAFRNGLVGNRIDSFYGIVNGSTNYILTQMAEVGESLEDAILVAQKRGFCEADPSLDVDGIDAAQKLVVLSELAFGAKLHLDDVHRRGIRDVASEDVRHARHLGFVIKHLASATRRNGALELRVEPTLVHDTHALAHVRHEFNGLVLRGDAVGEMMLQGKGAGGAPTASAVLADIVEVASLGDQRTHVPRLQSVTVRPSDETVGRYYLRFPILDRPGVIGAISTQLGREGVSISHAMADTRPGMPSDQQDVGDQQGECVVLTHRCQEAQLQRALVAMKDSFILSGRPVLMRIFESEV